MTGKQNDLITGGGNRAVDALIRSSDLLYTMGWGRDPPPLPGVTFHGRMADNQTGQIPGFFSRARSMCQREGRTSS